MRAKNCITHREKKKNRREKKSLLLLLEKRDQIQNNREKQIN